MTRDIYTYITSFFLFCSWVYEQDWISMSACHMLSPIVLNTHFRLQSDWKIIKSLNLTMKTCFWAILTKMKGLILYWLSMVNIGMDRLCLQCKQFNKMHINKCKLTKSKTKILLIGSYLQGLANNLFNDFFSNIWEQYNSSTKNI